MRYLNHIAGLLCLIAIIFFVIDFASFESHNRGTPAHAARPNRMVMNQPENQNTGTLMTTGMLLAFPGALWLLVDSFRRKYTTGRTLAWGLSIFGVLMPPAAFLYYVIWGRQALKTSADVYGTQFCPKCLAATTPEGAGPTFTINFIYGTKLIGSKDRCPRCNSTIKTKWVLFLFPIIPLGTYRVIFTRAGTYLSRKLA